MPELKFKPVLHDHEAFLAKARLRKSFSKAYESLELEYQVADQIIRSQLRAATAQDVAAEGLVPHK